MEEFSLKKKFWYLISLVFAFVFLFSWTKAESLDYKSLELSQDQVMTILDTSSDHMEFYTKMRLAFVAGLVEQGFDHFEQTPYLPGTFNLHLSGPVEYPDYPDFFMDTRVAGEDDLDLVLQGYFVQHKDAIIDHFIYNKETHEDLSIGIAGDSIKTWKDIFLFKDLDDLHLLGYDVSSYRLRENKDAQYRIDNIYISYYNIGNTRVLNPGEELSFMDEIHYDSKNPGDNLKLAYGFGQAGGVQSMYGGGICGGGFGFFGATAVNQGIDILERHNHTTRYRSLYDNELNGQNVWSPGLDTSVYDFGGSRKDFRIRNNRDYPIILVMNYDRTYGGQEEVFTLGRIEDRGTYSYLGKRGSCYVWEFNGEEFKSCYGSLR